MTRSVDQPLRAIIWDFGGVFDPRHEALAGFTAAAAQLRIAPEVLYEKLYGGDAWKQARIGKLTNQEYLQAVMAEVDPEARDVAAFREQLWAGQQLDARVVGLAGQLAARYPMALLSNATDELELTLERYGLTHLFRLVINSARVGVAKPEPRIYQLALEGLGVVPQAALFIDDKPRNILAAEKLGMACILFSDAAQLEQVLRERGLLEPAWDEG